MGSVEKPVVCIVTPGTRTANNGNWRTAARWAEMLRDQCRIIVQSEWDGSPAEVLIALHARRSAASIASFHEKLPGHPIAVVLTGTDLYKDLPASAAAAASLDIADRLVVLQEDASRLLEPRWQRKAGVIYQSARTLARRPKARNRLDCVVVGHLREEKDPRTIFGALALIPRDLPIHVRHIGAPLDPVLGKAAFELQRKDSRYRYSGALSHGLVRSAIKSAHVLVHPSIIEGGANVIVEAVTAGTPVVASRISGNIGMLGRGYPGYFEPGDASGLARCLVEALHDPRYLRRLTRECNGRRKLFTPGAEKRAVRGLVAELLAQARR
jgi:putative glycosyltransferase (TIGR04348 family)